MNFKINNSLKKIYNKLMLLFRIFVISFFAINISFALDDSKKDFKDRYDINEAKTIYKKQVKDNCVEKPEPHFKAKDYFENKLSDNPLKKVKKTYRENQNSLYSCALLDIQKNTIKTIWDKLISIDKTWKLKSVIESKNKLKIKKLDIIKKKRGCISPSNKDKNNNILNPKKEVLNESVYEFCKYSYYLSFLKNYYKNIDVINKEVLNKAETNSVRIWEIGEIFSSRQKEIVEEEIHSEKVFNMAFETYVDYENNYPVHVLLEIIKEDFKILRRKFHEAISPLNQVVYKISNAMSK